MYCVSSHYFSFETNFILRLCLVKYCVWGSRRHSDSLTGCVHSLFSVMDRRRPEPPFVSTLDQLCIYYWCWSNCSLGSTDSPLVTVDGSGGVQRTGFRSLSDFRVFYFSHVSLEDLEFLKSLWYSFLTPRFDYLDVFLPTPEECDEGVFRGFFSVNNDEGSTTEFTVEPKILHVLQNK